MELKIANHSHFPRLGEKPEQHKLRKSLHLFDRQKISRDQLEDVYADTIREAVKEQTQCQLDVVTDGLIRWSDPVSHFMKSLEGVSITGLLRFYDTNSYFRQPAITGPMKRKGSALKDEVAFLKQEVKGAVKVVLTGPLTLASLSKIQTDAYTTVQAVAVALTDLMAEEIAELSALGVDIIQIDEPAYLHGFVDWACAKDCLKKLSEKKGAAKLGVVTYFGDAGPVYDELQKLPVDFVGVDVTYSPTILSDIEQKGSSKDLSLGMLDGRNTKLEDADKIAASLKKLDGKLADRTVTLTTSCGLEFLPRDRAVQKLEILRAAKDVYTKGS